MRRGADVVTNTGVRQRFYRRPLPAGHDQPVAVATMTRLHVGPGVAANSASATATNCHDDSAGLS